MKIPSVPLQIVYKVVQVATDGSMWSCNPLPMSVREGEGLKYFIRYKLRHQVLPNKETKALFVCPTLKDAKLALYWYGASHFGKYYILRGYGANVNVVGHSYVDEFLVLDVPRGHAFFLPDTFETALCSWFIPIGIVGKRVL